MATSFEPFFGSGTTGLVAENLGRRYVGIEINPRYVALAEKEIGSAAQLSLDSDAEQVQ